MSTGLCPHCLIGMYPDEEAGRRIWYCGDCGYETPRRAVTCGGAVRLAVSGLAEEIARGAHVSGGEDGEGAA